MELTAKDAGCAELDPAILVHTHAALLFRVAHSILRNSSEAEDVVQDTFLRVLQHRHSLRAVRDLRVWLVRIAWNLALDRRRRIRPGQLDPDFLASIVSPGLPPDRAVVEAQQLAATLAAIDHLPASERQVLLLSALEELATSEIAAILGKSDSAIRALLFRARARLRGRLSHHGGSR